MYITTDTRDGRDTAFLYALHSRVSASVCLLPLGKHELIRIGTEALRPAARGATPDSELRVRLTVPCVLRLRLRVREGRTLLAGLR